MKPDRKTFLDAFLGAFGKEVVVKETAADRVSGTLIYKSEAPEERQEFCWHVSEADVPPEPLYRLACLIREQDLLDIDRIIPSTDLLREKYNRRWKTSLNADDFAHVLRELEEVAVSMVDDGEEGDAFFIHE
jgi:hypothetical protein